MTIADKFQTIAENEQKVYEVGKQAEYDAFWDQYQRNGKQNNYLYSFSGIAWTDEVYNPKYTIKPKVNASGMFFYSNVTDTKVTIDISELPNNVANMFASSQIKTIPLLIVSETTPSLGSTSSSPFQSCSKLENITIEGVIAKNAYFQWSPLTVASMKSIISHLANYAGTENELAYTLRFSDTCWAALEASGTAPDGGTWREYVTSLGWNT